MATKRDAHGNRICPKCGETLGINLGTQRKHDAQKHSTIVTSQFTRKSLHRRLEEAADARGLKIYPVSRSDGTLGYYVPELGGPSFTPGELAGRFGIEVLS